MKAILVSANGKRTEVEMPFENGITPERFERTDGITCLGDGPDIVTVFHLLRHDALGRPVYAEDSLCLVCGVKHAGVRRGD